MPKSWDEWAAFAGVAGLALTILGLLFKQYIGIPIANLTTEFKENNRVHMKRFDSIDEKLNEHNVQLSIHHTQINNLMKEENDE
ncbi:hypothetical protein ESZ50_01405 [Weissella muntiaci]|uniref:Uncharacterized protein n=1 Tax=Weissella muntiaci TaxID=2508881 RepID=A0A6C2C9V9_9LACO|nr:hypothetical protein [Weissella muntiaci]TYC50901.1 hypothetical protein ESZ50_01405 [Weissella muntiaci]